MQQNSHVIGIDVSKLSLDICAVFGEKIRRKKVKNDKSGFKELVSWIKKLDLNDPHICMESTGCYSESVAEYLYEAKFKVSVVNPMQIKSFRKSQMLRQKTDKADAEAIARFCLQNNPSLFHPKSAEIKELHELNKRIESLKIELNRVKNQMEKVPSNKAVLKSIKQEMKFIENSIKTLEDEAIKLVKSHEHLKKKYELLSEIKGVGDKTILTILADMPDVNNFENAKQYAAFVGVTPSANQSGSSLNGKSHISRLGSPHVQ